MWALLWKDVLLEWRTKERLSSLFVLAFLMLLIFVFALGPEQTRRPDIGAAMLWITLVFAGMLSLQRGFLLEQERSCLSGLLLTPIAPSALFLAKFLGNALFLVVVEAFVTPITLLLLGIAWTPALLLLPIVELLGIVGFSALGTLFSAIAVRTRAREVLLPIMLLPLLIPLLIATVQLTSALLAGEAWPGVWLRVLLAFDVIFVVTGWFIFGHVVQE
ncbi:MAG: heme exporter protein CcmB [Deltaproteobacteria bacterium]|nr:heme exporter protein CcmB [Deltaproteobacteria bacterium]